MADNVTDGSGNTFATNQVGGVHYPKEKIVFGADGSVTDVTTASGLPVNVVANTGLATSARQDTGNTSLSSIDGKITAVNTGAVTISAALPAGTNTIGAVKLTDGTDVADVLDLSNSNPLTVAIVDTNGDQIASFGGGTQYTEDAAAAANPVGTVPILIRTDTPATQVTTDGDNIAQRATNYGAAYVQVVTSAGAYVDTFGGGTQYTEDAAAAANPVGNALIVVREDARAGGLTTTDGDNVAVRGTNAGEIYVKHVDSIAVTNGGLTELAAAINASSQMDVNIAASNATVTISGAVTNAGTFVVQENGSALTALQLIDDGVYTDDTSTHSTGVSKGYGMMAAATPTDGSVNANDIGMLAMTVDRKLHVSVQDAIPAGNNNIGDVDIASIAAGDNNIGNVDIVTMPAITGTVTADTELPAAAALTDNFANPTAPAVGAFLMGWDGAQWDRLGTTGTGVLKVDLTGHTANATAVKVDGSAVTQPVSLAANATSIGKAEDGGHTTGETGVFVLGVRKDAPVSASTSADADYSQISTDGAGVVWIRQKEITSYAAAYRLADATNGQLGLSFTFAAQPTTNKQLATIYHTGAATKTVKLRRVELIVIKGQPGIYTFELRALSSATAPATGNPAITPRQYDPADGSAEATCLALPTTAGSQVGADTGTVGAIVELDGDALGPPPGRYMLYEYDSTRHVKPLIMRAANAEGYAVVARCTVASTLRFSVLFEFTEE